MRECVINPSLALCLLVSQCPNHVMRAQTTQGMNTGSVVPQELHHRGSPRTKGEVYRY